MQVTCESCAARYKLDDSRFSGRGARITCPRCQHVFVVYLDDAQEEGPVEDVGLDEVPAQKYHVDQLDFRSVGIRAWKVKVKIGLVYDFSDYKTLAKYITDGRVTTSDRISHDGKEWTEIGIIPDLKQHFIDVFRAAESAQNAAESPGVDGVGEFDGDEPTDIFGLQQAEKKEKEARAAAEAAEPAPSKKSGGPGVDDELMNMARNLSKDISTGDADPSGRPPRFVDPFEARKRRQQVAAKGGGLPDALMPSASVEEPSSGGSSGLLWVAVLIAAVLAGGYIIYSMNDDSASPDVGLNQGGKGQKGAGTPTAGDEEEVVAEVDALVEPDLFSAGDFVTDSSQEGEKQYRPRCEYDGTCGQGGPIAAPAETTAPAVEDTTDQADQAHKTGSALLLRNKRREAALSFQKASELEPANRTYQISLIEAHLYSSTSNDEASSASGCNNALAVLDGLRLEPGHGDYEYLRGQYWELCASDFEKAKSHYGAAAVNSEKPEWRDYASQWLKAME